MLRPKRWAFTPILLPLLYCSCAIDQPPAVRILDPFPFDESRVHDRDFEPTGRMTRLSENLFRFEDSCNVYIVRQGANALLIDFGTGAVQEILGDIGVEKIEQVLVTHHHRDQVQGLADLPEYAFRVTVPEAEAPLFENVESFWRDVRLYLNYDLRSHWNSLRRSVRVDGKVRGGDVVEWRGIEFQVLETPGATGRSISFSAVIDGRRVVFTGDLIAGPGKVHNWYDLHWRYYGFTDGINASEESFARVRAEQAEQLLPSHGEVIADPEAAMLENSRIYGRLREMLVPNELHRTMGQMRQILPHLIHLGGLPEQSPGVLNTYAIISDSGKALLYDYGYVALEQVEELKRRFNVNNIDVVTFSHYHDDHLIRVHDLLRDNETRIWAFEKMADVLENPIRYRLPCLVPFAIRPDRVVRDGERVEWEEYQLEFFHMPGQTEFHQGLVTVVDGRKVMFTGDNTWKKIDETRSRNGPVVPQNEYFLDGGFITCARKMLEYMPDVVCPAHTEEYFPTREDLEGFLAWANEVRDIMTALIAQPDPNFGMDYRWCHFYPYRSLTHGEEHFEIELVIRNHLFIPAKVEVEIKHSENVGVAYPVRQIVVEGKQQVAVPFRVQKTGKPAEREVITADLTINGHRLGEVAEALID